MALPVLVSAVRAARAARVVAARAARAELRRRDSAAAAELRDRAVSTLATGRLRLAIPPSITTRPATPEMEAVG